MAIKHSRTVTDPANPEVDASDWNGDHVIDDGTLSIAKTNGLQAALDGKQPVDATLTALAGLSTAANKLITITGAYTFSTADLVLAANSSSGSAPTGIVFTGTTAPSGAVTYDRSFQRIGNRCSGIISIYYATQGSAITNFTMDWPSDWPASLERGGFTAASMPQYIGRGYSITTTATTLTNGNSFFGIRRNSADTAFELTMQFSSGSYRAFIGQVEWDVA